MCRSFSTRVLLSVAVVFATLAMAPLATAAAREAPVEKAAAFIEALRRGEQVTIATLGTSLTGGTWRWVDAMKGWLDADFPRQVTIVNLGVGASASERYLPGRSGLDMLPKAIEARPDVVFIEFAINDAYKPYDISLDKSKQNLETMIDAIKAAHPKCEIIVQTMNCVTKDGATGRPEIDAYYQGYRDVAAARGLRLVDHHRNWSRLLAEDPKRFEQLVPDGVHPQHDGLRLIMLPQLKATLSGSPSEPASNE